MNKVKFISVLLTAVMCLSLSVTQAYVFADETAPSEVNASESSHPVPSGSESQTETDSAQNGRFTVVKSKNVKTATGMCGDKTVWLLDDSGTMTISGVGDMYDFETGDIVPWKSYKDSILAVVVSSGVSSVGERAFDGCKNLKKVTISETVMKIGSNAFNDCANLNSVSMDENLYNSYAGVFAGCPVVEVSFFASFPIIVNSGVSDVKRSSAGRTVTLTADIAEEGKRFDKWIVNRGEAVITVVDERTATFVMPSTSVEITATYKDTERKNNTLKARGKRTTLKRRKLRKKNQKLSRTKVMSVWGAKGRVRYRLLSVSKSKYKKYFKINSRTGAVTVKQKLRKGTYTVRCRVSVSGNEDYKSMSKTVSFKIKVK